MISILRKTEPVGKDMNTTQQQEGQVPTQPDLRWSRTHGKLCFEVGIWAQTSAWGYVCIGKGWTSRTEQLVLKDQVPNYESFQG